MKYNGVYIHMEVEDHGNIALLVAHTDEVRQQLTSLIQPESWQWVGLAIACEPRYVETSWPQCRAEKGYELRPGLDAEY